MWTTIFSCGVPAPGAGAGGNCNTGEHSCDSVGLAVLISSIRPVSMESSEFWGRVLEFLLEFWGHNT